MVLQQLIEVGNLKVSDCLLDENNVLTRVRAACNASQDVYARMGFRCH
jgi:hypothetical protein